MEMCNRFRLNISTSMLLSERERLKNVIKKRNNETVNSQKEVNGYKSPDLYLDEEERNFFEAYIEDIDICNDEILCLKVLEDFTKLVEISNARTLLKCKQYITENSWMRQQVFEFERKLNLLQNESDKLELEWKYKLSFYKMRHLQKAVVFVDKVHSLDRDSCDESDSYEPDESYSKDIRPICNIIRDNLIHWKNELAISWCQNILTIYRDKEGDYSYNVRGLYSFLGRIYKTNKQFKSSQICFSEALEIQEKLSENENSKGIINSLLGISYYKQNKFIDAEICFKKALKLRETIVGQFHPDMIDLYFRLASVYNKLEMWKESINNCLTSLQFLQNIYEEDDSHIIKSYLILIDNYIELRAQDKALTYLEKVCKFSHLKKNFEINTMSPLSCLLMKHPEESTLKDGSSMLIIYGPIQKSYNNCVIRVLSKYLFVFQIDDGMKLFIEWYDVSDFTDRSLLYNEKKVNKSKTTESQEKNITRTSSQDSTSSLKSHNLKKIGNKLRDSFKSFKRQF